MTRLAITMTIAVAGLAWLPAPAIARADHVRARPPSPPAEVSRSAPSRFYPEEVEGGVSGNLPFNNQIRKHTDPLNANGGR